MKPACEKNQHRPAEVSPWMRALRLPKEIPVVPCIATEWESVKQVILTLLEEVLKRPEDDDELDKSDS